MPLCQQQPDTGGLLVVSSSPLLDALSAFFDKIWHNAMPVTLGTGTSPDGVVVPFSDATTRSVFGCWRPG